MLEFYELYIVPFAALLTDMEREGIMVNMEYLREIEGRALKDRQRYEDIFRGWVARYNPETAEEMNINSAAQVCG